MSLRFPLLATLGLSLALGVSLAAQDQQEPDPADLSVIEISDGQEERSAAPVEEAAAAETMGLTLPAAKFEPGETFVNANTAYEAGDPGRATALYSELLDEGYDDGHIYYNLGNAFLRHGELGRAIAAYRRAASRLPRDQDLQANLSFARRSSKDALEAPAPSAVFSTLFFWHHGLSRTELGRLVLLLNLFFWGVFVARWRWSESEWLRWSFMTLLLLLAVAGTSLVVRHVFPTRIAVIVPQEIDVFNGPNEASVVRFKLHAGTEVRLEDTRPGWLRVALPDGQQGWIQKSWAEVVEL